MISISERRSTCQDHVHGFRRDRSTYSGPERTRHRVAEVQGEKASPGLGMPPVPAAERGNQEVVHGLVLVHLPESLLLPHREDGLHRVEAPLKKRVQPRCHGEDACQVV